MKERQYKVFGIFALLSIVLLSFQNCGSSKNASDGSLSSDLNADGTMNIINPVVTGGLQFTQNKTTVSSTDSELNIVGLCSLEQNGAFIRWSLQDQDGVEIFSGQSLCDKGSFAVSFEGVQDLECNAQLQLKAFFGAKAKTQIEINKNCF